VEIFINSRFNREQAGDVVEFEALAAADGQLLVVVSCLKVLQNSI
jgi:hypothetical protein